ncbi:MAG: hypothetical protein KatS3mg101_1064 [Patescibacteria group bacterium]|nr:MAG: hypothetical protein KatS3mg101_1064 [Patescibacteria group bacterium]
MIFQDGAIKTHIVLCMAKLFNLRIQKQGIGRLSKIQTRIKKTRNGKLITEDYGNYCKIRGEIEGKNYYFLYAHLEAGSVLPVGSEVKVGQVIGQIGNTGNSTAPHLHFEVRDENNNNIPVEFVDDMPKNQELVSKEQIIIDAYKAETGEFPTDDEKKWRLQQNLNTIQLIESLHQDSRFYEKWVKPNIPDKDISWHETALLYQESFEKIKELLGAAPAENTEEVIGRIKKLIERNKELEKLQEPKTIYKYENKDYVPLIRLSNIIVAIQKET